MKPKFIQSECERDHFWQQADFTTIDNWKAQGLTISLKTITRSQRLPLYFGSWAEYTNAEIGN